MSEIEFLSDSEGNLVLEDKVLEKEQFKHFDFNFPLGRRALVKNVKFLGCSTTIGTCVIDSGFVLDRVEFSNFKCGDAIRISSETILREVIVTGRKPSALLIRPENEGFYSMPPIGEEAFQIDISGFLRMVEIIGRWGEAVRRDPERHVAIKAAWKEQVDWDALEIGPLGFWRHALKKLLYFNADEGVFTLPKRSARGYADAIGARERLRSAGFCVD